MLVLTRVIYDQSIDLRWLGVPTTGVLSEAVIIVIIVAIDDAIVDFSH